MSLILEALRKSEAERHRGRLPALASELPPAPAPRMTPALPPRVWLLGGCGALALAFAAWLAGAGWPHVTRTRPITVPTDVPATTATPANPLPAVTRLAAPAGAPIAARAGQARAPHAAGAPPARDVAADIASARAHTTLSAEAPSARPPSVADRAVPPAHARAGNDDPGDPGTILSLADLDADTRKALPPLRLSMHLWDADPARRFVILDGNRLGEGDRIGPVVLTTITRDGALLDWKGRSIRIPLR
jgi:general secretion pathway protein B